jgi:hypothetical protein
MNNSSLSFEFKNISLIRVVASDMELLWFFGVRVRIVLCKFWSAIVVRLSIDRARPIECPGA